MSDSYVIDFSLLNFASKTHRDKVDKALTDLGAERLLDTCWWLDAAGTNAPNIAQKIWAVMDQENDKLLVSKISGWKHYGFKNSTP